MLGTRRSYHHWGEALLVDGLGLGLGLGSIPQRKYQAIPAGHRRQLLATREFPSGTRILDFRLPGDRRRRTFHRAGERLVFAFPSDEDRIVARATVRGSYLQGKAGLCVLSDWEWVSDRYVDVTVGF